MRLRRTRTAPLVIVAAVLLFALTGCCRASFPDAPLQELPPISPYEQTGNVQFFFDARKEFAGYLSCEPENNYSYILQSIYDAAGNKTSKSLFGFDYGIYPGASSYFPVKNWADIFKAMKIKPDTDDLSRESFYSFAYEPKANNRSEQITTRGSGQNSVKCIQSVLSYIEKTNPSISVLVTNSFFCRIENQSSEVASIKTALTNLSKVRSLAVVKINTQFSGQIEINAGGAKDRNDVNVPIYVVAIGDEVAVAQYAIHLRQLLLDQENGIDANRLVAKIGYSQFFIKNYAQALNSSHVEYLDKKQAFKLSTIFLQNLRMLSRTKIKNALAFEPGSDTLSDPYSQLSWYGQVHWLDAELAEHIKELSLATIAPTWYSQKEDQDGSIRWVHNGTLDPPDISPTLQEIAPSLRFEVLIKIRTRDIPVGNNMLVFSVGIDEMVYPNKETQQAFSTPDELGLQKPYRIDLFWDELFEQKSITLNKNFSGQPLGSYAILFSKQSCSPTRNR